jgi:ABC-type branched-subunit amino acid transport system ATPase component
MCGAYARTQYGPVAAILRLPRAAKAEATIREEALQILADLGLADLSFADVDALPGPARRLVDFGRALMARPTLLLLDEIAAGTTDVEKQRVIAIVRGLHRQGVTTLLIEHDLDFIRALADNVVVMAQGKVLAEGATDAVLKREDVLRAYVGE